MITLFRSLFAPPRDLVLLLAALWIGLMLAEKRAARYGISKEDLNSIVFYSLFGYILGGRILYAIQNFSVFVASPSSLVSINIDLFDPLSALVTAVFVGYVYGSRHGLQLWSTLDALAPLFAALAVGLPLSHLASGAAFGSPTALPWGIELWNATRHPTQIYELLAAILIFGLLWYRKADRPSGTAFLIFLALTAAARLFLEAFRGDSILILGGVRLAQVIAWLVLVLALVANETRRSTNEQQHATVPS
jgi:phosphatidylglycerol---prolipoprotein diacylglyceryl transferase